jgi:hypothetical protein
MKWIMVPIREYYTWSYLSTTPRSVVGVRHCYSNSQYWCHRHNLVICQPYCVLPWRRSKSQEAGCTEPVRWQRKKFQSLLGIDFLSFSVTTDYGNTGSDACSDRFPGHLTGLRRPTFFLFCFLFFVFFCLLRKKYPFEYTGQLTSED